MQAIQLFFLLFLVLIYSVVIARFTKRRLSPRSFIAWSALWIGAILVSINPSLVSYVSDPLGVGRAIDFVIYSAIVLLLYLNFKTYLRQDALNRDLTKVVRSLAIREKKK
ncbi:DUF2304 family protein [Candidatus Dojkabacteria bacterium]|nr:DUF2304 family protein [Candidatus Dojkabacteria bacterium]